MRRSWLKMNVSFLDLGSRTIDPPNSVSSPDSSLKTTMNAVLVGALLAAWCVITSWKFKGPRKTFRFHVQKSKMRVAGCRHSPSTWSQHTPTSRIVRARGNKHATVTCMGLHNEVMSQGLGACAAAQGLLQKLINCDLPYHTAKLCHNVLRRHPYSQTSNQRPQTPEMRSKPFSMRLRPECHILHVLNVGTW